MPTRHVVLLRAINGSPHNRLTMADLRARVETCGFVDVVSHLQTGNLVLVDPSGRARREVTAALDDGLAATGLVRTDAVVRSPAEMRALVAQDWFHNHPAHEWRRCAAFLRSAPGRDGAPALSAKGIDVVHSDDLVVLSAFRRDRPQPTLGVETAYRVSATSRWWNVVVDLVDRYVPVDE